MRKKMSNQTTLTEFLLLGFSDIWELQILFFVLFLVVYLSSMVGNILIILTVTLDHHLHIPMYFFLMNLSILDIGFVSVIIPKSMANSLTNSRSISYSGCVAQVFFHILFLSADFALLTVMAYDRYIAICQPLHYETKMNNGACIQMAAGALISGVLYSALHTRSTFALTFCGDNKVNQFFCEIPQLLKLTCSDSYLSEIWVIASGACLGLGCFIFIIVSYVQIFTTVRRIRSEQSRHKAFSTCIPHIIVVTTFLSTSIFAYLKPTSNSASGLDLLAAVFYSIVPPVMNPVIYGMRNKEIKDAVKKLIEWRLFFKNKRTSFLP